MENILTILILSLIYKCRLSLIYLGLCYSFLRTYSSNFDEVFGIKVLISYYSVVGSFREAVAAAKLQHWQEYNVSAEAFIRILLRLIK